MTTSPLAKRYSQALYEFGSERRTINTIVSDITAIFGLIAEVPQFQAFLCNPGVSAQKRLTVLRDIFEKHVSADTFRFISFLNQKNRLGLLSEICCALMALHGENQGILKVKVHSCFTLTAQDLAAVVQRLEKKFQKTIEPQTVVDPGMIGGIKIQVGDTVFDYGLKTQLEKFKECALSA